MTNCVHCGLWHLFQCNGCAPIWDLIPVPPVPNGDRVLDGDPGQDWTHYRVINELWLDEPVLLELAPVELWTDEVQQFMEAIESDPTLGHN